MKPGKSRRKVIEGNADTIIRQTTHQKPAAYRQCGGGGETKKGEFKENTGAKTRETNIKTLPQATIAARGRDKQAKTNTRWKGGTTDSPARRGSQSREGGNCLAENA